MSGSSQGLYALPPHHFLLFFSSEKDPSFSERELQTSATMMKTLSPYTNTAATTSKTAEIMSRYRPIAPKPELTASDQSSPSPTSSSPSSPLSQKLRQSPYLRNLWPQLQARPTRTRKRGRTAISPPTLKRQRTNHHAPPVSPPATTNNFSFQGFTPLSLTHRHQLTLPIPNFPAMETLATSPRSLVTLPLLPCPTVDDRTLPGGEEVAIDLSLGSHLAEIPEEKDLLQQLQRKSAAPVIAPQPVRPVGSSISVGSINEDMSPRTTAAAAQMVKKPEEVEEEVESEALPAVISDSNHKVRLANSAYKEMVGQPECSWLDSMVRVRGGDGSGSPCRRISGEVMLQLCDDNKVPVSSNKFSCWVRIEWGNQGKKSAVDAFCDVNRLSCESKDYLFTWRFHTNTRQARQPSSV